MAGKGHTKRPRSLKAEFSEKEATPAGGAAMIERVFRRIGLRKFMDKSLPKRSGRYSMADVVEQIIEGLLLGGKGFQATEPLRQDPLVAAIFGHQQVVSDETIYRVMCDLAGLKQRQFDTAYVPIEHQQARIDMYGNEKQQRSHRRIVPDEPEAMPTVLLRQLEKMLCDLARMVADRLPMKMFTTCGMIPITIDGSDLEVRGRCFDAARTNRHGDQALELMALRVGALYLAARVLPGATDEGRTMPEVITTTAPTVREITGKRPLLYMIDSAGAEQPIIDAIDQIPGAHYLIGANQHRAILARIASEQPEHIWKSLGPDDLRGAAEVQIGIFLHKPGNWGNVQTVVVRRWRAKGEFETAPWHYAFIFTRLNPSDLTGSKVKRYGFAALCWMLYDSKQGHENHFKMLLSDLGVHHPASGRLGASQAFALVSAMAANLYVALQGLLPRKQRGMRLRGFIDYYVRIAAELIHSGEALLVRLAGGAVDAVRKQRWLRLWAAAGRL